MPRRPAPKLTPVAAEEEDVPVKTATKRTAVKRAASASPSPAPAAKRQSTGSSAPAAAAAAAAAASPPKYSVGDKLMGYWEGKWYPVTIVSGGTHTKKKQWLYEIRWEGFTNTAADGELPTNESTYPENWIWTKKEVEEDEAVTKAKASKTAKAKPKEAKTSPAPAKRIAPTPAPTESPKPSAKPSAKPPVRTKKGISDESSPASQSPAAEGVRWQYFDNKKGGGDRGWHNYDIPASKKVEEAYQSWASDPAIDVRAVKSGQWNYMVDFNTMQQTNIDHEAHTVRKIRRMDATGQKPMMQEAHEIQRRVKLTRQQSQSDQLSRTSSTVGDAAVAAVVSSPATPASPSAATRSASQSRVTRSASAAAVAASSAASQDGWRAVTNISEVSPGITVRVSATPSSGYPYEFPQQFGKEATVLTVGGYPSVHLRFADGATYWYRETDLEIRASA